MCMHRKCILHLHDHFHSLFLCSSPCPLRIASTQKNCNLGKNPLEFDWRIKHYMHLLLINKNALLICWIFQLTNFFVQAHLNQSQHQVLATSLVASKRREDLHVAKASGNFSRKFGPKKLWGLFKALEKVGTPLREYFES